MKHLNKALVIQGALLIAALAFLPPAAAKPLTPVVKAHESRIVGVWDVTVTLHHCGNGNVLTSFPALHKYEQGGTGQIVPPSNPALTGAHMLVWEYLGDGQYAAAFKFFRFDGTGAMVGTTVITADVWVDDEGMQYGGSGMAELYDTAGNFIGLAGCPSFEGTRFTTG